MKFSNFIILESLDTPWNLEELSSSHPMHSAVKTSLKQQYPNAFQLRVFKATDNKDNHKGHIIEFANNDATEIHHIDEKNQSNLMKKSKTPNLGFAATMKHRIEYHVNDKGSKVRILGSKPMIKHYHKIVHLANKNKNKISDISTHEHPVYSDIHSFTIQPKPIIEVTLP